MLSSPAVSSAGTTAMFPSVYSAGNVKMTMGKIAVVGVVVVVIGELVTVVMVVNVVVPEVVGVDVCDAVGVRVAL